MSANWADFAEEEDGDLDLQVDLPERTETEVDSRGIKKVLHIVCFRLLFYSIRGILVKLDFLSYLKFLTTQVTFFERDENGGIVKVTQRVKVIKLRQKTALRTLERRKTWAPFGKAANGPEEGITYESHEEVFMLSPEEEAAEDDEDIAKKIFEKVSLARKTDRN